MKAWTVEIDGLGMDLTRYSGKSKREDFEVERGWGIFSYLDENGNEVDGCFYVCNGYRTKTTFPDEVVFRFVKDTAKSIEIHIGETDIPLNRVTRLHLYAQFEYGCFIVSFWPGSVPHTVNIVMTELHGKKAVPVVHHLADSWLREMSDQTQA